MVAVIVSLYALGKWLAPRAFLARLLSRGLDDDLLENDKRRTILELLEDEPGLHLRELGRAVGGYRNAVYHTRVLEDAGMVRSERDGGYKRFYPADPEEVPEPEPLFPDREAEPGVDREDVEPRSPRAKLLELVREEPGIAQSEAAWELGCSRQLVSYHARRLEDEGVIEREGDHGGKRLYPGGG